MENKLKLYGFNNLTKSLSFNIYDVCYAKTMRAQKDYIAYIGEEYNSERLTNILYHLTEMIGATVLSVSKQDYEPQGASVTFLIAEPSMLEHSSGDTIVAHLDKSHVTVHTYPEYHPDNAIATFRVDIDVATCGRSRRFPRSTFSSAALTAILSLWIIRCAASRGIWTARSFLSTTRLPPFRITSTAKRWKNTIRSI